MHFFVFVYNYVCHAIHHFSYPCASFSDFLFSLLFLINLVLNICFNFLRIFFSIMLNLLIAFCSLLLVLFYDSLGSCSIFDLSLSFSFSFPFKFSLQFSYLVHLIQLLLFFILVTFILSIYDHLFTHLFGINDLFLLNLFLFCFLFNLCFCLLKYFAIEFLSVIFRFYLQLLPYSHLLIKYISHVSNFLHCFLFLFSNLFLVQFLTKFLDFTPFIFTNIRWQVFHCNRSGTW